MVSTLKSSSALNSLGPVPAESLFYLFTAALYSIVFYVNSLIFLLFASSFSIMAFPASIILVDNKFLSFKEHVEPAAFGLQLNTNVDILSYSLSEVIIKA